jgi:putative membrane protein
VIRRRRARASVLCGARSIAAPTAAYLLSTRPEIVHMAGKGTALPREAPHLTGAQPGPLGDRTGLALDRTLMALDRTLMAWVRTGTSLISFGFTVYKFFQYLREGQPAGQVEQLMTPRRFALVMIAMGVGALIVATVEHVRQRTTLITRYHAYGPFHHSLAIKVAGAMSCLGLVGLVLVFMRQ